MADYASNSFQYNGTRYTLLVTMYNLVDGKRQKSCALDIMALDTFEYTNELNDLLLHGSIVYTDKHGLVDQFLEEQFAYCDVTLVQNEEKTDGNVVITKFNDKMQLQHTFLVDSIEILSREKSIVNYKIKLVSSNWFNCIANIIYSNYSGGPQPVFSILKNCLALAQLPADTDSFGKINSSVEIQYITSGDDNLLTIFQYLMRRLYYLEDRDDSLKFLLFNEHSGKYQVFDAKNTATNTGQFEMVVSFFKTSAEHMAQQEPVNFGVVTKHPKSKFLPSIFAQEMFGFEYDSNRFTNQPFSSEENAAYFSNKFDLPKTKPKVGPMLSMQNTDFRHRASLWKNDVDFYHDYQQALFETNALVVNSVGDILRKPGAIITIGVDRTMKDVTGENSDELDRLKNRYKTFEGPWIASRVRHIIEPNKGPEGNGSYRQNIVLMRNFLNEAQQENFGEA